LKCFSRPQTIQQFEQIPEVVENIDKISKQLKRALEEGKTIIVTTLQKFSVIADQIGGIAFEPYYDRLLLSEAKDPTFGGEVNLDLRRPGV
jgi:type I site-specific restriction-modification system R (restriction) subunit